MKIKLFLTGPMVFAITSLLVVGTFLFISTTPSKSFSRSPAQQSDRERRIVVRNYTENLKVVDLQVADDGRRVRLTLRNNHSKAITAFSVSPGGPFYTTDLIGTDNVIAPGANRVEEYLLPQTPEPVIKIQAVVFDDRYSEGNPEYIKKIVDARLGEKTQLNLIIPILENILSTADAQLGRELETNQSRIAQLRDLQETGSIEYRAALKNTKELILHHLEELKRVWQEDGTETFRKYLLLVKERYKRKTDIL